MRELRVPSPECVPGLERVVEANRQSVDRIGLSRIAETHAAIYDEIDNS